MQLNKYFLISSLLVATQFFIYPTHSTAYRKAISENEEVHYEVWKERRINYLEDTTGSASDDGDEILKTGESEKIQLLNTVKPVVVPKIMIDLFKSKSKHFTKIPNEDLIIRSFTCKFVQYGNSATAAASLQFDVAMTDTYEKLQRAELTFQITSNSSYNKKTFHLGHTGVFINGTYEKIVFEKSKSATVELTHLISDWLKNTDGQFQNLKLELNSENNRWLHLWGLKESVLLMYITVNSEIEGQLELEELNQRENELKLAAGKTRQKRKTLSNDVAPPNPVDDYEELEEFQSDINRNLMINNKLGIHSKHNAHIRRHLAKKMWGPCRKRPFYVDFSEVKFDSWILAPKGYQAYECYGRCGFPLGAHLTPTKHAIMRAMLNGMSPKKATKACCVPTKLEPISLLYMDDRGVVTYKYKYEGMIVADCGCR